MSGSDATSDQETVELPPDTTSIAIARRFVARALAGRVPREVIADLVLATSELVTNAIEHGHAEPVGVTVDVGGSAATVTVRSTGRAQVSDHAAWDLPSTEVRTGRGLGIVRRVSDHVDVIHTGDSLHISARRAW